MRFILVLSTLFLSLPATALHFGEASPRHLEVMQEHFDAKLRAMEKLLGEHLHATVFILRTDETLWSRMLAIRSKQYEVEALVKFAAESFLMECTALDNVRRDALELATKDCAWVVRNGERAPPSTPLNSANVLFRARPQN